MSKTIQVTLKPLDYFFFGTNETFDFGAKGIKNYSVKSNPFPQQTGLLGLLRHAFLTAGYAIGESFNPVKPVQNFGLIKSISPQYLIRNGNEVYYKCPLPMQKVREKDSALSITVTSNAAVYNTKQENGTFFATNYNPKVDLLNQWVNVHTGERVDFSEFFIPETHTGIDKGKTIKGRTDEGAYYRQQFFRLKNASFAFQAIVDSTVDIAKLPSLLPFGGEKRMFAISYSEDDFEKWESIADKLEKFFEPHLKTEQPCVLLLTDGYIPNFAELENNIRFAILQTKPFRHIVTPKTVTNFSRLGSDETDVLQLYKPTETTYLLKQGSLLFTEEKNASALLELLNQSDYSATGYNYFIKNF